MKSPPKRWFYKFWNTNEKIFIVSELVKIEPDRTFPFIESGLGLGYMNAKPLTVQEAVELVKSKKKTV